jgi:hypothetical protein
MSNPKTLIKVGVVGSVVAALCCFTPVLFLLLGALGLSALAGYLDYVLVPALLAFIGLTIYAVWRKRRVDACREACPAPARGPSS